MSMSTDELFTVLAPEATPSHAVLSLQLTLCFAVFAAVFAFWLSPGGLAWAISKARPAKSEGAAAAPAAPGPSGFPVLGLVFAFTGPLTHRVLDKLSRSLGAKKLMAFSVGFTRFIISSEPETAKEMLNSSAFADRPVKESAYELLFHRAMGFAPYGEYWRNLRRISATHLFSPRRIAAFGMFRAQIGLRMVGEVKALMKENGEVGVRKVLHFGSLNNVMMTVFGKSYDFGARNGSHGSDGLELEVLVSEGYELLGVFNWGDHFPLLRSLDLQGVRRRCRKLCEKVNVFVGGIIEDHRMKRRLRGESNEEDESSGDFVDVLLDLEQENRLSDSDMIAVLWVIPFFDCFAWFYL